MPGLQNIAVYCGATLPPSPRFRAAAVALGACIARRGHGLVFGGSNEGTMSLMAGAALENGAHVTGVFPDNLPDSMLMPGLHEVVRVHGLAQRKAEMLRRADAVVALPGSFGTWDELFDALAQRKIPNGTVRQPIGVLNIDGFYDHLLAFIEHSYQTGFTTAEWRHLLLAADTPDTLIELLQQAMLP